MKLIVMDLDGTLLNSQQKVSEESKEHLMKLRSQGYIIAIATGRTLKSALLATDGAVFAHCIISSSGAAVFDNLNKRLLKKESISIETAESILKLYNDNISYIEFNDLEYHNKYGKEIDYNPNLARKIDDIHEFLEGNDNIFQICIDFKNPLYANAVNDYIIENFKELNSYTVRCHYSNKLYIEMMKKGVSKYSAVSYLANLLGIANENVIAFGDSENDLDMIKNSGIGVAMGNAVDIIKENAKYTTKTNDENGIIEFLKLYL